MSEFVVRVKPLSPEDLREVNQVSELARDILIAGAESKDGFVMLIQHIGGASIRAGSRVFLNEHDPRRFAECKSAIEELERVHFVEPANHKRDIFRLTHDGYSFADTALSVR